MSTAKISFRQRMHREREDAIVDTVKRLLAEKGFEAMTVDEVAADVGIAKASLYRHFSSKEALAAAAMVQTLEVALAEVARVAQTADSPLERLRAVTRWALATHLAGQMPTLPSENSTLRAQLLGDAGYTDRLMQLSDQLGEWIVAAQASGDIDPGLPPELVLFTLYARACDPVPGFLKFGGRYTDDEVVDLVLRTCFDGLAGRRPTVH